MKALYLKADGWCAVYVNGIAVFQDHSIQPMEMLRLATKFCFGFDDVHVAWANDEDWDECEESGQFPELTEELKGSYEP
jgi:hypothetical protein